MITGVTDSYYTLVVSGNRNLIDIVDHFYYCICIILKN